MTVFEKSLAVLVSTVAFVILIAILVLSSMTFMKVQLQSQQIIDDQHIIPRVHRHPNGSMDIIIPEDDEALPPKYPHGSKLGEKTGDK